MCRRVLAISSIESPCRARNNYGTMGRAVGPKPTPVRSRSADRAVFMPPSWRKDRPPEPQSHGPLRPTGQRSESTLLDQKPCRSCNLSKPTSDFFDRLGKPTVYCKPCRMAWLNDRKLEQMRRREARTPKK
jgi:hypothetical protein